MDSRHHFTTWPKAISMSGAWSDDMSDVNLGYCSFWDVSMDWQIWKSNAGNHTLLGSSWRWSTVRSSRKLLQANCQTIESHSSSPWKRLLSLYPRGTDCNSDLHKYSSDPSSFLELPERMWWAMEMFVKVCYIPCSKLALGKQAVYCYPVTLNYTSFKPDEVNGKCKHLF